MSRPCPARLCWRASGPGSARSRPRGRPASIGAGSGVRRVRHSVAEPRPRGGLFASRLASPMSWNRGCFCTWPRLSRSRPRTWSLCRKHTPVASPYQYPHCRWAKVRWVKSQTASPPGVRGSRSNSIAPMCTFTARTKRQERKEDLIKGNTAPKHWTPFPDDHLLPFRGAKQSPQEPGHAHKGTRLAPRTRRGGACHSGGHDLAKPCKGAQRTQSKCNLPRRGRVWRLAGSAKENSNSLRGGQAR